MIFLTSALLGMVAISFRSAFIIVATVWLIAATFVVAALITAQVPTFTQITLAVLGYNGGIALGILAALVPRFRSAVKNA